MRRLLIILFFGVLISNLNAQPKTPTEYGLKSFCIKDKSLGEINFFVTKSGIKETKPLLILLDGSGPLPIYSYIEKDDGSSNIFGTIPFRYNKLFYFLSLTPKSSIMLYVNNM